jgi:hypothetical protein
MSPYSNGQPKCDTYGHFYSEKWDIQKAWLNDHSRSFPQNIPRWTVIGEGGNV